MMNDKKKIVAGLIIFIIIITYPLWFNLDNNVSFIEPELTEKAKVAGQCVLSKEDMVSEHMQLLDLWRHSVVRNGDRIFINSDGIEYNMSISNTCLDCHFNKIDFCDRCHNYASVEPYCWDCHIDNPRGD